MKQCTRFYIHLYSVTSSLSPILFSSFASFVGDPGLITCGVLSLVIFVLLRFACVLVDLLRVTLLSGTVGFGLLLPRLVRCFNAVVCGVVPVVAGGGHVNIPIFFELQVRSLKVSNRKIEIFYQ